MPELGGRMLVVVGANGRTGVEVVQEAVRRGLEVLAVVRDDRDVHRLGGVIDVLKTSYADPDHPDSLRAVFQGASAIISCIDPRTQGPHSPSYGGNAAENIVKAAAEAGAQKILHLSVMGAFRWSYARLNRSAFYLEGGVRNCAAPWTILRISCTFDEVLEAYVQPPDNGRPHAFHPSSRYAPMSRRDAGVAAVDYLDRMKPGRAQCVGGPRVYTGPELARTVAPYRQRGGARRTRFAALPRGDVSVAVDTTRLVLGRVPKDRMEDALDADDGEPAESEDLPVYARLEPGPHPADGGGEPPSLSKVGPDLRRVLHAHLVADLGHTGLPDNGPVTLDFAEASLHGRRARAHDGTIQEMAGVRVLSGTGEVLFTGEVTFLRDRLSEEFFAWWRREGIPDNVWSQLDMGVRRRLAKDKGFRDDPRVVAFASTRSESD